jgi:hypothetical protein
MAMREHTDLVKKITFITTWPSFHFSQFIKCFFYKKPKTAQNTTENNCIITHAQNTTTLKPNLFLTGMNPLLVTSKEESAFPSAKHSQGQLETPQSQTVPTYTYVNMHTYFYLLNYLCTYLPTYLPTYVPTTHA